MKLQTKNGITLTFADGAVTVNWPVCDKAAGGYNICRAPSRLGSYTRLNNMPLTDTVYRDPSPTPDCSYRILAIAADGSEIPVCEPVSYSSALFGENTHVYSPLDDPELMQEEMAQFDRRFEAAQFSHDRCAVLLKTGEYDPAVSIRVGFYMHVAGLGALPTDTKIGALDCYARWLNKTGKNNNALCNFWRGAENLSIDNDVLWAVSQATSMRRFNISGNLTLHDQRGWASGGFLADSVVAGQVDSGSQQQWLSRNCRWKSWTGENWNIAFVGAKEGCTPDSTWPQSVYTTIDKAPITAEKPYLIYDDNSGYRVLVPPVRRNSADVSWPDGCDGRCIDISDFYIAQEWRDNAQTINAALAQGKHLLLTPGVYRLDSPIFITKPDTVVLGLGLATLLPEKGGSAMTVADVSGVRIAGILFEAGSMHTDSLLTVGDASSSADHSDNPTVLSDLYFRVGGMYDHDTSVDSCLTINSSSVIGDHFWVWRADHGKGVGWDRNVTRHGIVVNGDDVTIYALMVEHFHNYQTLWNGERGRLYFYQSETPYDVPRQSEWMSCGGAVNGCASYKVAEHVKAHEAWALGIYTYHRDAAVDLHCAMQVPDSDDVKVHNCCAVKINGNPGISHVINDSGAEAINNGDRSIILEYCNGRYTDK